MVGGFAETDSIFTPRLRRHDRVDAQSAPGAKLVTFAVPWARLFRMAARCEIDLSPGGVRSPRTAVGFLTLLAMLVDPCVARLPGVVEDLLHTKIALGYHLPE